MHNTPPLNTPVIADAAFQAKMQLATPRERILACLINQLLALGLCMVAVLPPLLLAPHFPRHQDALSAFGAIIFILLWLGFIVYQCILMHQSGQSIGKQIMRIKVVNKQGETTAFANAVWMREAPFQLILWGVGLGVPVLGLLLNVMLWGFMLYLLFSPEKQHRTWQDQFADTWVVKA